MDENDLNQMEDIEVKTEVQTNYSQDDDYARWMDATLSVKFTYKSCKENLRIVYSEEKGHHTESRYTPTITRNELKGTTLAMKILFKNLDFEFQDVNEFIYCEGAKIWDCFTGLRLTSLINCKIKIDKKQWIQNPTFRTEFKLKWI